MDLEEISARLEIDAVLKKYYRGIDRTDYDLVRSCFFDDAQIDFGPFFKGSLNEFITYAEGPNGLPSWTRTFHFAGNTIIEIDGDVARSEVYAMAQHYPPDEHERAGFFTTWLRYIDRLERRNHDWRVADRHVVVEWIRRDTAGMWLDVPVDAVGRRDFSDPVYVR